MRVIAVDDEKLSLMRIERIIGEIPEVIWVAGYQSPRDALARQIEDAADIAFLDVEMPDMNGLALAERLVENNPDMEVVFVTAHEKYALSAYRQNAIGYLLKPIQQQDLRTQLERICRYRRIIKKEQSKALRCNVFGSFYLYAEPNPTDILSFRTDKSSELLALLIGQRGKPISRDAICELLWPDMSGERAVRNFHTTAYNIRHTFAEAAAGDVLLRSHDSYRINLGCVRSDLEIFCAAMETGEDGASRIRKMEAALAVYTGPYMADKDYPWLTEHQAFCEQLFEKLCLDLSREYEDRHELSKAKSTALRWLHLCPLSEEACARLMSLHLICGEREKAAAVYESFRQNYVLELEEETSVWLKKILR